MDERSLWRLALEDITTVMPLPTIRDRISRMTIKEMRRMAIQAENVDRLIMEESNTITPTRVRRRRFAQSHMRFVQLGPGAQWMLALDSHGTLSYYRLRNLEKPAWVIFRPETSRINLQHQIHNYLLIRAVHGECVAVISESYADNM